MADILIRGMGMPEKCLDCPFVSYDNDICILMDEDIPIYGVKPSWCPIVPIPEGHGRLIDAERFRVILCRLMERQDDDSATHALRWAIECLDKLESVVDAEGEDE